MLATTYAFMKANAGSTWGRLLITTIFAMLATRSHIVLNISILSEQGRPSAGHKWANLLSLFLLEERRRTLIFSALDCLTPSIIPYQRL